MKHIRLVDKTTFWETGRVIDTPGAAAKRALERLCVCFHSRVYNCLVREHKIMFKQQSTPSFNNAIVQQPPRTCRPLTDASIYTRGHACTDVSNREKISQPGQDIVQQPPKNLPTLTDAFIYTRGHACTDVSNREKNQPTRTRH